MIIFSTSDWQPVGYAKGGKGGGPATFMGYLGEYLRSHEHRTTNDPNKNYNLHFECSMGGKDLVRSMLLGIPILIRLNGIPSASNLSRFWRLHIKPYLILSRMAYLTVYQSRHCKKAWSVITKNGMQGQSIVIYNGAEPSKFYPISLIKSKNGDNTVLMHEHFRRDDGGLRASLHAFMIVKRYLPNTKLILAGNLSGPMNSIVNRIIFENNQTLYKSVHVLGPTNHKILPNVLRTADVFVHTVANSWCPHSVLEALSCGVPVICYSGTGPAEFVKESGIVLPSEYEGVRNGFKRFPHEDPKQLADAIIKVLKNKHMYREKARARSSIFSSEVTCEKYMAAFEKAVRFPPNKISMSKAILLMAQLQIFRIISRVFLKYEETWSLRYINFSKSN